MKTMHWSESHLNWITVEVIYTDGSIQTWDYDCIQYLSEDDVKTDMENDFSDPNMDRKSVMIHALRVDTNLTADLSGTENTGEDFVTEVFDAIGELTDGN